MPRFLNPDNSFDIQRIFAPSTDGQTFFLIETQHGADPVFSETSRFFNEANCVREIIEGQFENIIRVLAVTPDEGTCRDVSEDVARMIAWLNPEVMSAEAINLCSRFKCLTFDLGRDAA